MKIKRFNENSTIPDFEVNEDKTEYTIWKFFDHGLKKMGIYTNDHFLEAIKDMEDYNSIWKDEAKFHLSEDKISITILTQEEIDMRKNAEKYNL